MKVIDRIKIGDKPIWSVDISPELGIIGVVCGLKCYLVKYKQGKLEVLQSIEPPHSKTIRRISIKPSSGDGKYPTLAMASFDGTCSIFGSDSIDQEWELLAVIEGHESEVKCVDWSYDGKYLTTCGRDKSIWVWETDSLNEEFECISVLNEHEGDVKAVKWSPVGYSFVSCSYDDSFKIWKQDSNGNEDQFDCVASFQVGATVWDCCWVGENGIVVGLGDGRVLKYVKVSESVSGGVIKSEEVWELAGEWEFDGAIYGVGVSGENIITGGESGVVESSVCGKLIIDGGGGLADINCLKVTGGVSIFGDEMGFLTLVDN